MKIKRIEWLKETENEKMEIEQKGRLTRKITQEIKMETAKIGCRQMKNPNALSTREVGELIADCKYAQTPEMIDYYKSLNPSLWDVLWLIIECKYAQSPEMLDYFKSLNPSVRDVVWLIAYCKYAQTPEMLKYFKSLKPSVLDVRWLIKNCDYCNTKNMRRYYKALNIILENE